MTHVVLLLVALFAIGCLAVEKRRDDKVRSHFTYFANNFRMRKKIVRNFNNLFQILYSTVATARDN